MENQNASPATQQPPITNQKSAITESQTEDMTTGQSQITHHPSSMNRSTGPRTPQGKRRSSQNAFKHGLYASDDFFRHAALALGEDPRKFQRLFKGLAQARPPADALEWALVEDIAFVLWKKARLERSEAAVQVCNLHQHDLEQRKLFLHAGEPVTDLPDSELREKGLRRGLDAPGKFEQALAFLRGLVEMLEKNEFNYYMQESLRALYGTDPTLRGSQLYTYYFKLAEMKLDDPELGVVKHQMTARVAEEMAEVGREYELFLHEHLENARAARLAATAPTQAQWAVIIRQENALHRQLEHKIRLLEELQDKRKKTSSTDLPCRSAALPNPYDAPQGGGPGAAGGPDLPCGSAVHRPSARPNATGSEKTQVRVGGSSERPTPSPRPERQACATPCSENTLERGHPARISRHSVTHAAGRMQPLQGISCFLGARQRTGMSTCHGVRQGNPKKILNRGNELQDLLQTKGLGEITPSKRTPFCAQNGAFRVKKVAFQAFSSSREVEYVAPPSRDAGSAGFRCRRIEPRRGGLTKPRPTAWVRECAIFVAESPERAK